MKMKKNNLLILAVAALGFAACTNDETTAINETLAESNAISFRTSVAGNMRTAVDITTANLTDFKVTAFKNAEYNYANAYIPQETFSGTSATSYTSTNKYYWPATDKLDFYAYSPIADGNGLTISGYNTFVVTPTVTTETVGSQADLIYAAVKNKGKTDADATGQIALNFRHAGAKVALKVTHANSNSAKTLYFKVKGWAVGYLDKSATFTFPDYNSSNDANTVDHNPGTSDSYLLPSTYWSNNTGYDTDKQIYRSSDLGTAVDVAGTAGTPTGAVTNHTFAEEMILIPQSGASLASKYSATTADAEPNGTFVAVKLAVYDVNTNTVIVPETWAMWPATVSWEPGKKYTYNVQLDEGGYYENNTDAGNDVLDPIFKGAVISFASVTVDEWREANVNVTPAPAP